MPIAPGNTLPDAKLLRMGDGGPETVSVADLVTGRNVVIFGLPGAYTGTCTTAHVPSFIRTMDGFRDKGVDKVICVAVNDPFVMAAWADSTGAAEAGIEMLADPASEFTKAVGMNFSAPPVGFHDRSKRYALYAEGGVVKQFNEEPGPGQCEVSAGETLLAQI